MSTSQNSSKTAPPRKRMSRPKRSLLAAIILLGVMVYYLVPFVITQQKMSDSLRETLDQQLGAPVKIGGDIEITYWPRPRVNATAVSIARPDGSGPLVYGNTARLTANFGLTSALFGTASFSGIKLDGAVVIIEQVEDEDVRPANALGQAVADVKSNGATSSTANGPGEISLTNSTLGYTQDGETAIAKQVNAELDWPVFSGKAQLSGTAHIANQDAEFSLEAGHAAALFAGRSSPVDLSISADAANIRFDGTASTQSPYLVDGTFSLSTGALQDLMVKMDVESRLLHSVNNASLSGTVTRSGKSMRFSPVALTIGEAKGNGVLDIMPASPDGPVEISATIAFQDVALFDAESSLPAWVDAIALGTEDDDNIDLSLPKLDLRISSASVKLSDLTLRDVAASIIRTSEQTSFDIADSRLDDGSLFAHVAVRDDGTAKVRMNAEKVHAGALFQQLGFSVPLESDSLDLTMSYSAQVPLTQHRQNDLNGTFRVAARSGSLEWLDLSHIIQSARTSENFAFSPLKRTPFAFSSMTGSGSISGSTVQLKSLEMNTAEGRVRLAGNVDINSGEIDAMLTTWGQAPEDEPISVEISGNALAALARRVDTPEELLSE